MNTGQQVYVGIVVSGTYYQTQTSTANITTGVWTHLLASVQNGTLSFYINGELKESRSVPATITSPTSSVLRLGKDAGTNDFYWNGSLALVRASKTAPSAEQIAKIYNDEKFLFQAGAQSTLYDDTDAVTALAYDDATDLLHVGTADGRSTFQGLRRVANTTAAVSVAISASNGLVVED
jgi:hypothetical protein